MDGEDVWWCLVRGLVFFSGWCRWLVRDPLIPTWTMLGQPTRMRS